MKFLSLLQGKIDFRWIQERRIQEKYFYLIVTGPLSSTLCKWKVLIILPIRQVSTPRKKQKGREKNGRAGVVKGRVRRKKKKGSLTLPLGHYSRTHVAVASPPVTILHIWCLSHGS